MWRQMKKRLSRGRDVALGASAEPPRLNRARQRGVSGWGGTSRAPKPEGMACPARNAGRLPAGQVGGRRVPELISP